MSTVRSRPRRAHGVATRLLILGLSLTPVAIASESKSTSAANEPTQVSDCLTFTQDPIEGGVTYRFTNSCKKRLACTLEWTLSCGDKAPYRKFHRRTAVPLAPNGNQNVTAEARACKGDSWEILDAAWACSP